MSTSASMADLALVAAGIAVIIGVVGLITSIEVSKRLQALVDAKLADADVRLSAALDKQDKRISTLRQVMSQLAEDNETAIRSQAKDIKEIRECIGLMNEVIRRLDQADSDAKHDPRFPPRKKDASAA